MQEHWTFSTRSSPFESSITAEQALLSTHNSIGYGDLGFRKGCRLHCYGVQRRTLELAKSSSAFIRDAGPGICFTLLTFFFFFVFYFEAWSGPTFPSRFVPLAAASRRKYQGGYLQDCPEGGKYMGFR